jgi:7 transmembrane receptor (rhodopsin family).
MEFADKNVCSTFVAVAVVVAFFICWAPFHAQRLLAVYGDGSNDKRPSPAMVTVYRTLTYTSGVLYYMSTTVNPVLYHIMSHKFREAFKVNLLIHMRCVFTALIGAQGRTLSFF